MWRLLEDGEEILPTDERLAHRRWCPVNYELLVENETTVYLADAMSPIRRVAAAAPPAASVQRMPAGTGRQICELVKDDVLSVAKSESKFFWATRRFPHGTINANTPSEISVIYKELARMALKLAMMSYHKDGADVGYFADVVTADIESRAVLGEKKYGERLRAHNGRDALLDLYQELLDGLMYCRQYLEEYEDTVNRGEGRG